MEAVWYLIVSAMLSAWAVLDGFDFGVGIVHRVVARTDDERGRALAAIGPVWDGNEVWLVAAGGVFRVAFPRALAAAPCGGCLPPFLGVWLVVFRGVAVVVCGQKADPLWGAGLGGVV